MIRLDYYPGPLAATTLDMTHFSRLAQCLALLFLLNCFCQMVAEILKIKNIPLEFEQPNFDL